MFSKIKKTLIGDRSFYKRVMAVSLPIMVQNGITTLVSMLDNIMVGRVGNDAMTGVAIANQLILIFYLAIFGAVAGTGIFGAQFFGKKYSSIVRKPSINLSTFIPTSSRTSRFAVSYSVSLPSMCPFGKP